MRVGRYCPVCARFAARDQQTCACGKSLLPAALPGGSAVSVALLALAESCTASELLRASGGCLRRWPHSPASPHTDTTCIEECWGSLWLHRTELAALPGPDRQAGELHARTLRAIANADVVLLDLPGNGERTQLAWRGRYRAIHGREPPSRAGVLDHALGWLKTLQHRPTRLIALGGNPSGEEARRLRAHAADLTAAPHAVAALADLRDYLVRETPARPLQQERSGKLGWAHVHVAEIGGTTGGDFVGRLHAATAGASGWQPDDDVPERMSVAPGLKVYPTREGLQYGWAQAQLNAPPPLAQQVPPWRAGLRGSYFRAQRLALEPDAPACDARLALLAIGSDPIQGEQDLLAYLSRTTAGGPLPAVVIAHRHSSRQLRALVARLVAGAPSFALDDGRGQGFGQSVVLRRIVECAAAITRGERTA